MSHRYRSHSETWVLRLHRLAALLVHASPRSIGTRHCPSVGRLVYGARRTFEACGPFSPWMISYSTRCPSRSEPWAVPWMPEEWTKTSFPPLIRGDESVTLPVLEPLDDPHRHAALLRLCPSLDLGCSVSVLLLGRRVAIGRCAWSPFETMETTDSAISRIQGLPSA
jgi:hypothetical protein